jgi:hypothetical protein
MWITDGFIRESLKWLGGTDESLKFGCGEGRKEGFAEAT